MRHLPATPPRPRNRIQPCSPWGVLVGRGPLVPGLLAFELYTDRDQYGLWPTRREDQELVC